jgi:hypothetical protein
MVLPTGQAVLVENVVAICDIIRTAVENAEAVHSTLFKQK